MGLELRHNQGTFERKSDQITCTGQTHCLRYTPRCSWGGLGTDEDEVDGTERIETTQAVSMTTAEASNAIFQAARLIKGQSSTALDSQQTRPRIRHLRYSNARRYSGSQLWRSYQDESQCIQKSKSLSLLEGSKEMQDQGLSGYSAAPLTSSAPLRLGKCRVSWVGLGFRCFRLSACSGRGSHRHASSSFVSVQTRTAQSWQDLAPTSVFNSVGNDLFPTNWWPKTRRQITGELTG